MSKRFEDKDEKSNKFVFLNFFWFDKDKKDDHNKSNKNYLMIILFSVVGVVIGFLLFWDFNFSKQSVLYENTSPKIPYQNPRHEISIDYPHSWEIQEQYMPTTGEIVTFLSPNNNNAKQYRDRVIISIIDLSYNSHPLSLTEYSKIVIDEIENKSNLNLVKSTLSDRKAETISYQTNLEGHEVEITEIWTLYHNKAYVITYIGNKRSLSQWSSTIEKMIDSFKIDKQS